MDVDDDSKMSFFYSLNRQSFGERAMLLMIFDRVQVGDFFNGAIYLQFFEDGKGSIGLLAKDESKNINKLAFAQNFPEKNISLLFSFLRS